MKASFFTNKRQKGVTLIELMIAIAIFAIVVALAVPSFQGLIVRKNLQGAAEKLFADLQFAKSESIKRSTRIYISFKETTPQCYGLSIGGTCDCQSTTCTIDGVSKVVNMTEFGNTAINSGFGSDYTYFDPRRGVAALGGTVTFSNAATTYAPSVVVSLLRTKIIK